MKKIRGLALVLLIVGLSQMAGDVLGIGALKGVGAATMAAPAPKVFSAVQGLETYSSCFFLEWRDLAGEEHCLELTGEVYERIKGPYQRRNVYGAALAYGPVLAANERTRPMLDSVLRYALCGEAPLLRELGIDADQISGSVCVRCEPLPGTDMGDLPRLLEAPAP